MNETGTQIRDAARRQGKRLFVWLLVAVLVLLALSLVFFLTPFEGPETAADHLDTDDDIAVEAVDGGYAIQPAQHDSEAGLVFYPGARVAPNAYLDSLAPLAREANVTVVIPEMPLNLAIVDYGVARTPLGEDAATTAIAANPDIEQWYVGGHSLGGAMACRYAGANTERIDGLLLYGSYCDRDIADSGLAVLSIAGSGDTVIDWEAYNRGLERLPADATVVELDGLNHSHFGSYTGQRGDAPTGTSYESAHQQINEDAVPWFRNETSS